MKFAIKTLKNEKRNAFFYLLFLLISTMIMTFYMDLLINQQFDTIDLMTKNIVISLSFGTIILIILISFFGYQSFLNTKTKLLGVFKLSGVGLLGIMRYLMLQSLLLLCFAFPIGIGLGLISSKLFSVFILQLPFSNSFISMEVFGLVLFTIGVEVFYFALISLGFIYRNEVTVLLGYQKNVNYFDWEMKITNFEIPKMTTLFAFLLLIYVLLNSAIRPNNYLLISIIAIQMCIPKLINKSLYSIFQILKKKWLTMKSNWIVCLSHAFILMKGSIVYIQIISVLLLVMVCFYPLLSVGIRIEKIVFSMYIIILFCFLLAFTYQIFMSLTKFSNEFNQLTKLGFGRKRLKKLYRNELLLLYGMVSILVLIFPFLSGIQLVSINYISLDAFLFITSSYFLSAFISYLIVYYGNRKIVFQK